MSGSEQALRPEPSDADWSRASDVLDWLYEVTGDEDVRRVSDLLDDTMRVLP